MSDWFGVLSSGMAGAIFLWIGLMVLIEGDLHALVTRALACATIAAALFYYGELAALLFPFWRSVQAYLVWWVVSVAAVGWYAVAMYHTRGSFSAQRWRVPRAWLMVLIGWAGVLVLLGGTPVDLFRIAAELFGLSSAFRYAPLVVLVQMVLWSALLIFIRARVIYHRAPEMAQNSYGLLRWFILATVCAIAFTALAGFDAWLYVLDPARASMSVQAVQWAGLIGTLSSAVFLLGAITTNRKLLGRPVRTPYLFVRGGLLLAGTSVLLLLLELTLSSEGRAALLALPFITAIAAALLDWKDYRAYKRTVEQYGRFIHDSISAWPTFNAQACRRQAQRIFDDLVARLEAETCYFHLQPHPEDEAWIFDYRWPYPVSELHDSNLYDLRPIALNQQVLGRIALRGPRGIAYSTLELDLAESFAYSIAGLYLDSRQAQALDALVVRRERERQEQNQRLQRVLHDQVGGNLDAILKAAGLMSSPDPELTGEITDAAQESILLIRDLIRGELASMYPPILQRVGLLGALRSELLPRCQRRHAHVEISIEANAVEDSELNGLLNDELRRTMYAALEEAIRNATKYAGGTAAKPVWIRVRLLYDDDGLVAEVRDNGVGFIPALASHEGERMGLRYYHAALRMAGGTMTVESQPGHGTMVRLFLPSSIQFRPPAQLAHSALEWARLILATERRPGGRFVCNDHFSDLTHPCNVSFAHYRSRVQDAATVEQLVEIDEQRRCLFDQYLQHHRFLEIADLTCVRRYITHGITDTDYPAIGVDLAHQHIRHVIWLLREQPNYQLAFSDQPFETNFAVKPRFAVLWEKRPEHGQSKLDGVIEGFCDTEPRTVAEFTRRFHAAWNSVPWVCCDKSHVIGWLEAQLDEAA